MVGVGFKSVFFLNLREWPKFIFHPCVVCVVQPWFSSCAISFENVPLSTPFRRWKSIVRSWFVQAKPVGEYRAHWFVNMLPTPCLLWRPFDTSQSSRYPRCREVVLVARTVEFLKSFRAKFQLPRYGRSRSTFLCGCAMHGAGFAKNVFNMLIKHKPSAWDFE